MLLKPLKAIVWTFVIGFGLVACKKDKTEPTPAEAPKFYPVSVTRTASYTSDITRAEYSYNSSNQIVREMIYKNGALQDSNIFVYNAAGKLITKTYHSETGDKREEDQLTYNAAGFVEKLSHGYFNATGQIDPHHFRVFEFDGVGKIKKWTDFMPNGSIMNSRTYSYDANGKVISPSFGSNGQLINTSEITLDQHLVPFKNTTINPVMYTGNELKHEVIDLNNQVIASYSNTIIYTENGYPEKITQTHSDGTIKTETYQYKPE